MARQGKGIFGNVSGNISNIQGSVKDDKNTIRSKPKPSIKTQTQALIKTKTDFNIALSLYELAVAGSLKPLFEKTYKQTTAKQHFISLVLRMLNGDGKNTAVVNVFPESISYDRMRVNMNWNGYTHSWNCIPNQHPRTPKAHSSDRCMILNYNGFNGDIFIQNLRNRGTGYYNTTQTLWVGPNQRRFRCVFFTSSDFKTAFKGYAMWAKF